jgi:hypothetical protein
MGAKFTHKTGLNLVGNGTHASNAKDIGKDDGNRIQSVHTSLKR